MFINALIKVANIISKIGSANLSAAVVREIPLVLKISQFQRQQMMQSLNPKADTYELGRKMIKSLLFMLEKEEYLQI